MQIVLRAVLCPCLNAKPFSPRMCSLHCVTNTCVWPQAATSVTTGVAGTSWTPHTNPGCLWVSSKSGCASTELSSNALWFEVTLLHSCCSKMCKDRPNGHISTSTFSTVTYYRLSFSHSSPSVIIPLFQLSLSLRSTVGRLVGSSWSTWCPCAAGTIGSAWHILRLTECHPAHTLNYSSVIQFNWFAGQMGAALQQKNALYTEYQSQTKEQFTPKCQY